MIALSGFYNWCKVLLARIPFVSESNLLSARLQKADLHGFCYIFCLCRNSDSKAQFARLSQNTDKIRVCKRKLHHYHDTVSYHNNSAVMVGEAGFGPAKSVTTDLQSAPFGRSGIPPGAGDRSRTNNLLITNQLLCH